MIDSITFSNPILNIGAISLLKGKNKGGAGKTVKVGGKTIG